MQLVALVLFCLIASSRQSRLGFGRGKIAPSMWIRNTTFHKWTVNGHLYGIYLHSEPMACIVCHDNHSAPAIPSYADAVAPLIDDFEAMKTGYEPSRYFWPPYRPHAATITSAAELDFIRSRVLPNVPRDVWAWIHGTQLQAISPTANDTCATLPVIRNYTYAWQAGNETGVAVPYFDSQEIYSNDTSGACLGLSNQGRMLRKNHAAGPDDGRRGPRALSRWVIVEWEACGDSDNYTLDPVYGCIYRDPCEYCYEACDPTQPLGQQCTCKRASDINPYFGCTSDGTCLHDFCEHQGRCNIKNEHSHYCECPYGYTGRYCHERIDRCSASPCGHNGTCQAGLEVGFTCACPAGYGGATCDEVLDCAMMPCYNGACQQGRCICNAGWEGSYCDRASTITTTPSPSASRQSSTSSSTASIAGTKAPHTSAPALRTHMTSTTTQEGSFTSTSASAAYTATTAAPSPSTASEQMTKPTASRLSSNPSLSASSRSKLSTVASVITFVRYVTRPSDVLSGDGRSRPASTFEAASTHTSSISWIYYALGIVVLCVMCGLLGVYIRHHRRRAARLETSFLVLDAHGLDEDDDVGMIPLADKFEAGFYCA
eukprot:TRINITY_DN12192_c0_g4_i1.p1 TRINITY_DN12192_c0_g4~~TRINITY_DN12192_c0_g4_i1.p1  ORF type:complete len:600 (+),score=63.25 TRINITY_DN12192_c0_g4_i1:1503-3302(+)